MMETRNKGQRTRKKNGRLGFLFFFFPGESGDHVFAMSCFMLTCCFYPFVFANWIIFKYSPIL